MVYSFCTLCLTNVPSTLQVTVSGKMSPSLLFNNLGTGNGKITYIHDFQARLHASEHDTRTAVTGSAVIAI